MSQKNQRAEPSEPEALHLLGEAEMQAALDVFLQAVLATCIDISKSEGFSNDEIMKLARAAIAGSLEGSDVDHLSERARRTFSMRLAWAATATKRRTLADEDPKLARMVDGMLFDTVLMANYLAQMGEDRVQFMEDVLDLRTDREKRSYGGRKGAVTRAAWHAEARELFDHYRAEHPGLTIATRIRAGMNRVRRIPGSSDRALVELIRQWLRDERTKKNTELDQVS